MYPPERFAETRLNNIPASTETVYSELTLVEPWLVWLRRAAFTPNANLAHRIEGTIVGASHNEVISFGLATPPLEDEIDLNIPFDYDVHVNEYSGPGGPVNNYQSRVIWEAEPYTVVKKLSMGVPYGQLNEEEKGLADKWMLARRLKGGWMPQPYPKGELINSYFNNFSGAVPVAPSVTTGEITMLQKAVPLGYKMVLTGVWGSNPVANFGSLEIRVYREKKLFLTIFPYCLGNFATVTRNIPALDLWTPALSDLRVCLWSGTGHVGITAACKFELRRLTIWDKIQWGLLNKKTYVTDEERAFAQELSLEEKTKAGIYDLVSPFPQIGSSTPLGKP